MPRIDLHCHTTASDGILTPDQLIARAKVDAVDVIAITDHDTTAAVGAAAEAGAEKGVRVVAGIELSARHGGRNVHMLGYFLDPHAVGLNEELERLRVDRLRRARAIVDRLREIGADISFDDVLGFAEGNVVGRPHIARALVAGGHVTSVRDAFTQELIADGGRADVPKQALTPEECVRLITVAGGVAVIAHPGVGHHDGEARGVERALLAELRDAGMAGMEVDHPDHPPLLREQLQVTASELGLIATGGSDFHGDPGHVLGACTTSAESFVALEARAGG